MKMSKHPKRTAQSLVFRTILSTVILIGCAQFSILGCGAPSVGAGPPIPPKEAEIIWRTTCATCHKVQSLRAKDVSQIKRAMDQTPDMKHVRGKFEDRELEGILRWLKAQAPAY